jgi:hypothetical protein
MSPLGATAAASTYKLKAPAVTGPTRVRVERTTSKRSTGPTRHVDA